MCLYIKNEVKYDSVTGIKVLPKMKVAEKDIVCYKILTAYVRNEHIFYRTPFTGDPITLGDYVEAEGYKDIVNMVPTDGYKCEVIGGFIHTFKYRKDAVRIATNECRDGYRLDDPVIVKCIIPKGTRYYAGVFENTFLPSYATEALQYGTKSDSVERKY